MMFVNGNLCLRHLVKSLLSLHNTVVILVYISKFDAIIVFVVIALKFRSI